VTDRSGEERVGREATEELAVVVVEAEHVPNVFDPRLALGADADDTVRALPGANALESSVDGDRRAIRARVHDARRVARVSA
jgi:hypothetical protein